MRYEVTAHGTTRVVDVELRKDGKFVVAFEGATHVVDLTRPTPEALHMLIDGESWEAGAVAGEGGWLVDVLGLTTAVEVVDPRRKALRLAGTTQGGTVTTQMPGRVVRILVKVGEAVKKGQPLLVVEAMKMENEMKSSIDGTVAELLVADGQAVESGTKLVRIE